MMNKLESCNKLSLDALEVRLYVRGLNKKYLYEWMNERMIE